MTTNTGDNFDPHYPEGIDFVSIGAEEDEREPLSFEEWMEQEGIHSVFDWGTEDYYQEYLEEFNNN